MPRLLKSMAVERLEDGVTMVKARVKPSGYTEGEAVLTFEIHEVAEGTVFLETTGRPHPMPPRLIGGSHCWACAQRVVAHFIKDALDCDGPPPTAYLCERVEVASVEPEFPEVDDAPIRVVPLDSEEGRRVLAALGITVPVAPGTKH